MTNNILNVYFVEKYNKNCDLTVYFFSKKEKLNVACKSAIKPNEWMYIHTNEMKHVTYFQAEDVKPEKLKVVGYQLGQYSRKHDIKTVLFSHTQEDILPLVKDYILGLYRFNVYNNKSKFFVDSLYIEVPDVAKAKKLWKQYYAEIQGMLLTRDFINEPANVLTPDVFAERCIEIFKPYDNVNVHVLSRSDLTELGFRTLLAVAKGSVNPPRVVIVDYTPRKTENPVLLVGKGVCFDSGGLNLKPGAHMDNMHGDMGGAAAVIGAIKTLVESEYTHRVVGIIGAVENMPGGNAYKPNDIIKTLSGKTVRVKNTDAEGRLVLADIMWYGQEMFKPKYMVEFSTLTGAVVVALGYQFAGLFSNHAKLAQSLLAASENSGDLLWSLPVGHYFDDAFKDNFADLRNISKIPGGVAGASTAATFLQNFVQKGVSWAHIDIAGTAISGRNDFVEEGATGYGVTLISRWLHNFKK